MLPAFLLCVPKMWHMGPPGRARLIWSPQGLFINRPVYSLSKYYSFYLCYKTFAWDYCFLYVPFVFLIAQKATRESELQNTSTFHPGTEASNTEAGRCAEEQKTAVLGLSSLINHGAFKEKMLFKESPSSPAHPGLPLKWHPTTMVPEVTVPPCCTPVPSTQRPPLFLKRIF